MKRTQQPVLGASLSRRAFFRISAAAGVGLAIGIYLPSRQANHLLAEGAPPPAPSDPTAAPLSPNIYVTLAPSGLVTVNAFRVEMGQGIRTAIAMILAEELDVAWEMVHIEQIGADRAYGDQVTGGSVSVSGSYTTLRRAGAAVRQLLITAAAQEWQVKAAACTTTAGYVLHPDGKQRRAYGDLVATAATLSPPKAADVPLKDPSEFKLIGTPRTLYDAPQMVNGSAIYASDVRLPNMLYAAVARSPAPEGKVVSFDATKTKTVPGVRDVIEIDRGLVVVAENTWAALRGRDALKITWDEGRYATWSSASIRDIALKLAPVLGQGKPKAGETRLEAGYDLPYLAHATMEPRNCVVDLRADRCEVWAPVQDPQQAKSLAQRVSGLPAEAVIVHVPLVGGGFGRGLHVEFVGEAVQIAKAVGAPIQLVWSRTDDLQHDFYHPLSYTYVQARLDATGKPSSLPSVRSYPVELGIPTGPWRGVQNVTEAFARESFIDEIAAAGNSDPYELRLALVKGAGRQVIELAAAKADWGKPLPAGWGRGMAYYATFNVTHVAQVAEVEVAKDGVVRVHRVVCAVDCGTVINPDTVSAQMEGGIVYGLTAALKAQITIKAGRVEQKNFDDYPLLAIHEMPTVEVHLVPGEGRAPTGIGEMGVAPIAPAVANAIFAATGIRVRHLPILPADLRQR
ncbi:MAG: xanthine dehydrogenase family protein molybdopterin-binding subunit [Caldilinea sp. CFX5]|nr:xanthine dehydrogenase family protein molybdopterin-binding subunit [Caldilinea sp. CFX5]